MNSSKHVDFAQTNIINFATVLDFPIVVIFRYSRKLAFLRFNQNAKRFLFFGGGGGGGGGGVRGE